MPAGEPPLIPAASWHPGSSDSGGHGQGKHGGMEMQRSRSTLARLTRSVIKLGGSKASRARQSAVSATASAAAHRPPPSTSHRLAVDGSGLVASDTARAAGSGLHDIAATTAARIKLFEEGAFNLEADLGSLSEKGVERLRGDLAQLDSEVVAHLKAAVHEHYAEFVRAMPGILRLEGQIQQLRNLLHNMGNVVAGLADVSAATLTQSTQQGSAAGDPQQTHHANQQAAAEVEASSRKTGDGAKWLECLDDADVAVAERHLLDALSLLRRLEKLLQRFVAGADSADPVQQARLDAMAAEVEQRRERLVAIAEQQVLQPIATSADICAAADLLARGAGQAHAHGLVLEAYAAKLKRRQAALLRPANSGGGDADGADYAAALGQRLALALAAAADDTANVFGREGSGSNGGGSDRGEGVVAAELSAAFLVWALHQTERACHLLRKHALLPFAAPAGLHTYARCAFAFASHCAALEASHGLQLVPTVQRELWPVLEQVLARRVRKLGEGLRRAAASEVEGLAAGAAQPPADLSCWEGLAEAFPSANYLLDELEAIAAECVRLHSPRLAAAVRRAVSDLFQLYTTSLATSLNRQLKAAAIGAEVKERLAAAAEAAMELSTLLLERLLPEALAPLSDVCGEVCNMQVLADHLVRMGEALGMAVVPLTPGGSLSHEAEVVEVTAAGAQPRDGGEEEGRAGTGSREDTAESEARRSTSNSDQ